MQILDNPLEYVREHPSIFLPSGEPADVFCAFELAKQVVGLGASEVSVCRASSWWIVGAARDWFVERESLESQFSRIIPCPQLGQNRCRIEVVIYAFSADVCVFRGGTWEVLKGMLPDEKACAPVSVAFRSMSVP